MSMREDLAQIIHKALGDVTGIYDTSDEEDLGIADAILAAGYGKLADAEAQAYGKVIARIELGTPYMVNEKYVAGANWVRAQIEDVLVPTIEDALETDK